MPSTESPLRTPRVARLGYYPEPIFNRKRHRYDAAGALYNYRDGTAALKQAIALAIRFMASERGEHIMSVAYTRPAVLASDQSGVQWRLPNPIDPFSIPMRDEVVNMRDALRVAIHRTNFQILIDPYTAQDGYFNPNHPLTINIRESVSNNGYPLLAHPAEHSLSSYKPPGLLIFAGDGRRHPTACI